MKNSMSQNNINRNSLKETPFKGNLLPLSIAALVLLATQDAMALNAGAEMGASANRLAQLINGNVMHVIMLVGLSVSVVMSFYKSSFVPVAVGIGAGVLYGFAYTWVNSTFAMCI